MLKPVVASVVFVLFINFVNVNGWRSFKIEFTNVTWGVHSDKINFNMTVTNNKLNLHYTVKKQLLHPTARIGLFFQTLDTGRYDLELINRTVDLCKLFRDSLYEPLLQIVYKTMLEYGEMPTSCPIRAKQYYIENMYIDAEKLPPYMPERKGYMRMVFMDKENNLTIPLAESATYFAVKSSALNRFKGVKNGGSIIHRSAD